MSEEIGKHKGAVETLMHEKKELSRLLQIVNSQLQKHLSALEEAGVDTDEFLQDLQGGQQKKQQERGNNSRRGSQQNQDRNRNRRQRGSSRNQGSSRSRGSSRRNDSDDDDEVDLGSHLE